MNARSPVNMMNAPAAIRSWRGAMDRCSRIIGLDTSHVRWLLRVLDARSPRLMPSLLTADFSANELRHWSLDERTDDEPIDEILRLAVAAMRDPTFVRLFALTARWDPEGDIDADCADTLQPALSDWWNDSPTQTPSASRASSAASTMLSLLGFLDPEMRQDPRGTRCAVKIVLALYGSLEGDEALELRALADPLNRWLDNEPVDLDALMSSLDRYRATTSMLFGSTSNFSNNRYRLAFFQQCAYGIEGAVRLIRAPGITIASNLVETSCSFWGRWQRRDRDFSLGIASDAKPQLPGAAAIVRSEFSCPELRRTLNAARVRAHQGLR
ncbi:MAG: hypothetical protein Q8Q09_05880 [Deltaproteobacteria bacterium]|nr:hypothetical protein [Deltaproteobacteria bacterium]